MTSLKLLLYVVVISLLLHSCKGKNQHAPYTFTILQLNDVYEIGTIGGGSEGGMARVATIRKQLLEKDSNTITMLSGDFVSPSLLGTLKNFDPVTGDSIIAGKQMVEVMNAMGVDYVTFGNHEFDIPMSRLRARINESEFDWVSSNVFRKTPEGNMPFLRFRNGKVDTIQPYIIREIKYSDGKIIRLGIIGVTLDFNKADSVAYGDVYSSVKTTYDQIEQDCDVVIALTHLTIDMDKELARVVPGLDLIIGGHEHVHSDVQVGTVRICKADANAKSVYVHRIKYSPKSDKTEVNSELKMVDSKIAFDSSVNVVVKRWEEIGTASMRKDGYDPDLKLMTAAIPLDGREEKVRTGSTNYTRLIASSLVYASPTVDLAFYNSGSLRLDDELHGIITQKDVLRSLPFGGVLVNMKLPGKVLLDVIDAGLVSNLNNGGFLQFANLEKDKSNNWMISGKNLEPSKEYLVLMPEFVARGKEKNLEFLSKYPFYKQSTLKKGIVNDIRNVVIAYMQSGMTNPLWNDK